MGAAQSQETLIWTLVVPSIVAAVSCGFCLVYRYSFNQPIVGEYTAPPPSAAWSRPVGTVGTAVYDGGGGGSGGSSTKPSDKWGYQETRNSPYRLQLSGRVQTVRDNV